MILYIFIIALFISIIFRMKAKTDKIKAEAESIRRDCYYRNKDKINLQESIDKLSASYDKKEGTQK